MAEKDQTSNFPSEIFKICGPEEVFQSDYFKSEVFPCTRPVNAPITEPTTSVFCEEEILNPEDNFYFESDHLALKGNKDYRELLKTIVTLQAQRTRAIKDLEELLLEKKKALDDPIAFVAKMQNGDLPEYPGPQNIAELPVIDWSKYNVSQPGKHVRPHTRHARNEPQVRSSKIEDSEQKQLIRGREYNESKPETFNKLWTVEEQRRLEDLLIEYPPEEIEMRRWTKIANALGKNFNLFLCICLFKCL